MKTKVQAKEFSIAIEGEYKECSEFFKTVAEALITDKRRQTMGEQKPVERPVETLDMSSLVGENKPMRPMFNTPKPVGEHKKLVFFKCPNCGDIFCKVIDLNQPQEIVCMKCDHAIPFDKEELVVGSYICPDCHAVGKFLMQPIVNKVRCKDCDNVFYMVQDAETKEYEGKLF